MTDVPHNKEPTLMYFPQYWIELNLETKHHPELQRLLANFESKELLEKLAVIATYCDVLLDGYYIEQEIEEICTILIRRMKEKRALVVSGNSSKLILPNKLH